jgi:hypothetical protein
MEPTCAYDESNVSLTAFLGKTWVPCGETPGATVTGKRAGIAANSAISRNGHLLFRLLEKRIASKEVIEFLAQMLKHHPRRHLVVAWTKHLRTRPKRPKHGSQVRRVSTYSTFRSIHRIGITMRRYGTTSSIKSWQAIKPRQKPS